MFIDAHGHWADLRIYSSDVRVTSEQIKSLETQKITGFLEAGVDPEGWLRQLDLQNKFPLHFKSAFGLHPYFVATSTTEDCEKALDELPQFLKYAIAIGETGLDFRDQYASPEAMARQFEFFENQIQMAQARSLPLVLHVVRAHNEALRVLDLWGSDQTTGMVHAFNSSFEIAQDYIQKGFFISIGSAITYDKNIKLKKAVKNIPIDRLLIESDSPDQPPQGWGDRWNSPSSLWLVADEIARIKELSVEQVLQKTTDNFKTLFRCPDFC